MFVQVDLTSNLTNIPPADGLTPVLEELTGFQLVNPSVAVSSVLFGCRCQASRSLAAETPWSPERSLCEWEVMRAALASGGGEAGTHSGLEVNTPEPSNGSTPLLALTSPPP